MNPNRLSPRISNSLALYLCLFLDASAYRAVRDQGSSLSAATLRNDAASRKNEEQECNGELYFDSEQEVSIKVDLVHFYHHTTLSFGLPHELIDVLPSNYRLFFSKKSGESGDQYAAYIAESQIASMRDLDQAEAYICFAQAPGDPVFNVQFLYTTPTRRNMGFGQYLMIIAAYVANLHQVGRLELDDDSDKARAGSLYERLGCDYVKPAPFSDMVCDVCKILSQWSTFTTKYPGRGFFNQVEARTPEKDTGQRKRKSTAIGVRKTIQKRRTRRSTKFS